MLKLEHATIRFGSHLLLREANLALGRGSIKGFVAPNGYGKTTVMRILAGELGPLKRGIVRIDGAAHQSDFRSPEVLYVPGDSSFLYPYLTVANHLRFAASLWNTPTDIDSAADRCGIAAFMHKRVAHLSQGMKQQVALAIAYLCSPHYLLLDEATTDLLKEMSCTGTGILISSHILENLDTLCDNVLLIKDKRLNETRIDDSTRNLFLQYYV